MRHGEFDHEAAYCGYCGTGPEPKPIPHREQPRTENEDDWGQVMSELHAFFMGLLAGHEELRSAATVEFDKARARLLAPASRRPAPSSPLDHDVRLFAEDLIAEIGSMSSVQSWSKVETEARRSAYNDVLATISDHLARLGTDAPAQEPRYEVVERLDRPGNRANLDVPPPEPLGERLEQMMDRTPSEPIE